MCPARPGCPRTPSRTTDVNLDCAFVENVLVLVVLNIGGPGPLNDPMYLSEEMARICGQ